jgi:hypothetical protein
MMRIRVDDGKVHELTSNIRIATVQMFNGSTVQSKILDAHH